MNLPKSVQAILGVNIASLLFFGGIVIQKANFEFVLYIGVIIFFLLALLFSYKKIQYPNYILWCLTIWSILHMAGGLLIARGDVWYNLILIPISESLSILKYDQAVHVFGFFTATLLMYVILKPLLKNPKEFGWPLAIILIAAGSGAGAWNEIVEFIAQASFEDANVGGYLNTSLDTISNLIGGVLAYLFLKFIHKNKK